MSEEIREIHEASGLPAEWDDLAAEYFQTKEFLVHSEKYNPCNQRYFTIFLDGQLKAGAVMYTLKLNLLTYLFGNGIKIPMNILGIPCSVSSGGLTGDKEYYQKLFEHLRYKVRGLLLALNMDFKPVLPGFIVGKTLPTIIVHNRFKTWDIYIRSLRSSYRRRYNRIIEHFLNIDKRTGPCSEFSNEMYRQYLEVLRRSKGKLETLELPFFQNLPGNFILTSYYDDSRLAGWHITTGFRDRYYFFMGGIDYMLNRNFFTYYNMLFNIIKHGIEANASVIDMGQTAEIPKMRLGGVISEKYMTGYHSNFVFRRLLQAGKGLLEYSGRFPETSVIKEL